MSDSVWPHRQQSTRLPRPWDSPGKNTGVGCHFLLQCMKVKSESEVTQSCPTSQPHSVQFSSVQFSSVQFNSVTQSCPTFCDPMNRSTPGLPVHHQFLEFTQTHVHWVSDAIQPSHPLLSPSPPAPNPSQHQGLFQWVNSLHEVAKVLEFQLQHQSLQWIFRNDLL